MAHVRQLEMSKDPLYPIAGILKSLREALAPVADIQKRMQALVLRVPDVEAAVKNLMEGHRRFAASLREIAKPASEALTIIARSYRLMDALDRAGWLPHYTTPFGLITEHEDFQLVHIQLSDHYQTKWPDIRAAIEDRLAEYLVDEEAKATYREALDAHSHGLYRSVCRVLFPEIERVARLEIYDGRIAEKITSQQQLRRMAGQLTPGSIQPIGFLSLSLFGKLEDHLYRQLKNESDRKRCAEDAVPNRHAALHGLVVYASMQNSLNTIFMTEYIFQVIDIYKKAAAHPTDV